MLDTAKFPQSQPITNDSKTEPFPLQRAIDSFFSEIDGVLPYLQSQPAKDTCEQLIQIARLRNQVISLGFDRSQLDFSVTPVLKPIPQAEGIIGENGIIKLDPFEPDFQKDLCQLERIGNSLRNILSFDSTREDKMLLESMLICLQAAQYQLSSAQGTHLNFITNLNGIQYSKLTFQARPNPESPGKICFEKAIPIGPPRSS